MRSKLLFFIYSYTSIFWGPSVQHPRRRTRFLCWMLVIILTSARNSFSPCWDLSRDNVFTATSLPSANLPCQNQLNFRILITTGAGVHSFMQPSTTNYNFFNTPIIINSYKFSTALLKFESITVRKILTSAFSALHNEWLRTEKLLRRVLLTHLSIETSLFIIPYSSLQHSHSNIVESNEIAYQSKWHKI